MTVYVNSLKKYPECDPQLAERHGDVFCSMVADSDVELNEFAIRIGLKTSWANRTKRAGFLFYGLTPGRRDAAVKLGAKACDAFDWKVVIHKQRLRVEAERDEARRLMEEQDIADQVDADKES